MATHQTDWANEIDRLIAIGERTAAEGMLNLSKLVEAAAYANMRRSGWRYRPMITRETLPSELEASIQSLKLRDIAPELIAAMEAGVNILNNSGQDDLLADQAPDVFVCRNCGNIALIAPPEHCPDCGAWPGRFRKFIAMFNGDNAEPTNPITVIQLLTLNAADLARLVSGLTDAEMSQKTAANEWSIHEHIAHFYDTQEMLDARIDLMLNYDNPEITPLAIFTLATKADRHPASSAIMLAEFCDRRAKCVSHLEELPLKDLWRSGRHPEFGQITILRQAAYMAYHEQTHLPEIEALCKQVAN